MTIITTPLTLPDRLRFLCTLAENSGAPADWLRESADLIVSALLDLQNFERDHVDPRRRVSLARAARMANTVRAMREAGHSRGDAVAALCVRERLSKGHVYALLRMNV
jgi:hypothetical protein